MNREFDYTWNDHRGSHGIWCREKFYETVCRWCGQNVWYFECKHGSKVFFHDVPWWSGTWIAECPADPYRRLSSEMVCPFCGTFMEEGLLQQHIEFRHKIDNEAPIWFEGYPLVAVFYYGPTDRIATKVVVGIFTDNNDIAAVERWSSNSGDIRRNASVNQQVADFIKHYNPKSVARSDKIMGCPHTEGIDYPKGESCPHCPFWAKK